MNNPDNPFLLPTDRESGVVHSVTDWTPLLKNITEWRFFEAFTKLPIMEFRKALLQKMENVAPPKRFKPNEPESLQHWLSKCKEILFPAALRLNDPIWEDLYSAMLYNSSDEYAAEFIQLGLECFMAPTNRYWYAFSNEPDMCNKFSKLICGKLKKSPHLYWMVPHLRYYLKAQLGYALRNDFDCENSNIQRRALEIISAAEDVEQLELIRDLLEHCQSLPCLYDSKKAGDIRAKEKEKARRQWMLDLEFCYDNLGAISHDLSDFYAYMKNRMQKQAFGICKQPLVCPREAVSHGKNIEIEVNMESDLYKMAKVNWPWKNALKGLAIAFQFDGLSVAQVFFKGKSDFPFLTRSKFEKCATWTQSWINASESTNLVVMPFPNNELRVLAIIKPHARAGANIRVRAYIGQIRKQVALDGTPFDEFKLLGFLDEKVISVVGD